MLLSLVSLWYVEADAVAKAEGNTLGCYGIVSRLHRGRGTWHADIEVTQEPGRPCHLRLMRSGVGNPASNPRLVMGGACSIAGANKRAQGRYLRDKETKPEEKGDRESECSIVPMSQGNLPEGTLRREGDTVSWNL